MTGKAPAGWYPDPQKPEGLRYWNGAAWTEHQRVIPAPASAAPSEPTPRLKKKAVVAALVGAGLLLITCFGIGAFAISGGLPTASTSAATTATASVGAVSKAEPASSTPTSAAAAVPVASPSPAPAIVAIPATVVRVVDGDTAVFRLAGGAQEKVRFIGIDTPESTNSIEAYGKEASAYTAKRLSPGTKVFLEKDQEERDKYGRLLAYVWTVQPTELTEAEIRKNMFNARLALDGFAQQMTIQPNSKYADYFTDFVAEARDAQRGLWRAEAAASAPAPAPAKPKTTVAAYIGNRNTMKFHYAACSSVGEMNPSNQVPMQSREQAISGGYIPCKRCNP